MAKLPDGAVDLLHKPFLAHVGTLMRDGSPQVTPVWIDTDGEYILVNTAEGRTKTRNVRRNPKVSVSVADPDNPITGALQVRGTVVEITAEGANAHIEKLSFKYVGAPYAGPKEGRLIFKIRADALTGGVLAGA